MTSNGPTSPSCLGLARNRARRPLRASARAARRFVSSTASPASIASMKCYRTGGHRVGDSRPRDLSGVGMRSGAGAHDCRDRRHLAHHRGREALDSGNARAAGSNAESCVFPPRMPRDVTAPNDALDDAVAVGGILTVTKRRIPAVLVGEPPPARSGVAPSQFVQGLAEHAGSDPDGPRPLEARLLHAEIEQLARVFHGAKRAGAMDAVFRANREPPDVLNDAAEGFRHSGGATTAACGLSHSSYDDEPGRRDTSVVSLSEQ